MKKTTANKPQEIQVQQIGRRAMILCFYLANANSKWLIIYSLSLYFRDNLLRRPNYNWKSEINWKGFKTIGKGLKERLKFLILVYIIIHLEKYWKDQRWLKMIFSSNLSLVPLFWTYIPHFSYRKLQSTISNIRKYMRILENHRKKNFSYHESQAFISIYAPHYIHVQTKPIFNIRTWA